jgi:hypothetical protein
VNDVNTFEVVTEGLARLEDELQRFCKAAADSYSMGGLRRIIEKFTDSIEDLEPVVPAVVRKRLFSYPPQLEVQVRKLRTVLEEKGLHIL